MFVIPHITLLYCSEQYHRFNVLSEERVQVIGQIRKIEGFSNFLQAVPYATVQKAAAEGPVILINMSHWQIPFQCYNPPYRQFL